MFFFNKTKRFWDDAAEGRYEKVLRHIKRGIDINARNPAGGTALMIAAKRGHLPVVRALLNAGADPNIALHEVAYRALHTAAQEGFDQIVDELVQHGADVNAATQYGETALISAAYYGKTNTVKALLSHGADPKMTDAQGNKASAWARQNGHISTANFLEDVERTNK